MIWASSESPIWKVFKLEKSQIEWREEKLENQTENIFRDPVKKKEPRRINEEVTAKMVYSRL